MDLSQLPDHIKGRILSHLLQPRPPPPAAPYGSGGSSASKGKEGAAASVAGLQGKSLAQCPVVLDGFLPLASVQALLAEGQQLAEEKARTAVMGGAAADAKWADSKFRGDTIVFLRPEELSASGYSALPSFLATAVAQLRPWLAAQGYDVAGRPTFQLGRYTGGARYVRHRDASLTCAHRTVTALLYLNPGWKPEDGGELCIYHMDTDPPPLPQPGPPAPAQPSHAAGPGGAVAATASSQPSPGGALEGAADEAIALPGAGAGREPVRSGLEEGHAAAVVPPVAGRLVVFDSRTLHEVLPSHAPRYAVAVWFTRGERAEPDAGQEQQQEQQQQQQAAVPQPEVVPEHPAAELKPGKDTEQSGRQIPPQQRAAAQPPLGMPLCSKPAPGLDRSSITLPGHIFVSIPSYRDSETQWTLLDLFKKADRPELVRAGVVWQVDWAQDAGFVRIAPGGEAWLPQVRQTILPCSEATGPCKARYLAQQLYAGEEFYLQIDSHMRFVPGWDTELLGMLQQAEQQAQHCRVVLSTYPPGYTGEGHGAVVPEMAPATLLCATHFDTDGMLRIKGRTLRSRPAAPLPSLFWAAGFSFSRAQLLQEVPYDPSLSFLFFGEEMIQLVRMWQRGWDVYAPPAPVVFHLWSRAHRPTIQKDALGLQPGGSSSAGGASQEAAARLVSQQRVLDSLGRVQGLQRAGQQGRGGGAEGTAFDSGFWAEEDRSYVRCLADFHEHCGVDFANGTVTARAEWGGRSPEDFLPSWQDLLGQGEVV